MCTGPFRAPPPAPNYINLTVKWYISKNFQHEHSKPLILDEFVRYAKFTLIINGDKRALIISLA